MPINATLSMMQTAADAGVDLRLLLRAAVGVLLLAFAIRFGVPEEARTARPEAYNLLGIYAALSEKPMEAVLEEFAGAQFSHFKAVLTDLAVAVLGPIGAEMQRLCADPGAVDAVLRDGAERARAIAEPVLDEVYDVVGFLRP